VRNFSNPSSVVPTNPDSPSVEKEDTSSEADFRDSCKFLVVVSHLGAISSSR